MTPFHLREDEIRLIQDLRQLTPHERRILAFCIHRSATAPPTPEPVPRQVIPIQHARR